MSTFKRSHISYFGYFAIAFYAFNQMGLGPIMPYMQSELGINFTQTGLYVTLFAAGMIVSGFIAPILRKFYSRKHRFYIGFVGFMVSLAAFLSVRHYVGSLASVFFLGSLSTILLIAGQALLADNHGDRRDTALTEANIWAATTAILCPLLLGAFTKFGLNWRFGIAIPLGIGALVFLWYMLSMFEDPVHKDEHAADQHKKGSQLLLYIFPLVGFLGVCCEWGFMFWAPQYIERILGFAKSDASLVMSLLYVFFVIGRAIGSRLTTRFRSSVILIIFIVVAILLFPLFWIESYFIVNFAALAGISLCVANFFPLSLSVVMGVNPSESDKASGLMTIASGAAILSAPLVLGIISDNTGLKTAYLSVAVLLVLMGLFASWGQLIHSKKA